MARRLTLARELACDLLALVGARTSEQIDPVEAAKELRIQVAFGSLDGATARIFRVSHEQRNQLAASPSFGISWPST